MIAHERDFQEQIVLFPFSFFLQLVSRARGVEFDLLIDFMRKAFRWECCSWSAGRPTSQNLKKVLPHMMKDQLLTEVLVTCIGVDEMHDSVATLVVSTINDCV
jgi:hypothetical protein